MNKTRLIKKVSERMKITPNAAKGIVNSIFNEMRKSRLPKDSLASKLGKS